MGSKAWQVESDLKRVSVELGRRAERDARAKKPCTKAALDFGCLPARRWPNGVVHEVLHQQADRSRDARDSRAKLSPLDLKAAVLGSPEAGRHLPDGEELTVDRAKCEIRSQRGFLKGE